MKSILIITLIMLSYIAKAQDATPKLDSLPEVNGKVFYESIVTVSSKSKDFIFSAAEKWVNTTFDYQTISFRSKNKSEGSISAVGSFGISNFHCFYPAPINYSTSYTIQIDCKDGKYRIRLFNILNSGGSIEGYNYDLKKSTDLLIHQDAYWVDAGFKHTISSLAESIQAAVADDF